MWNLGFPWGSKDSNLATEEPKGAQRLLDLAPTLAQEGPEG